MRIRAFLLLVSLLIGGIAEAVAAPPEGSTSLSERMEWLVANPEDTAVADVFSGLLEDARSIADLNAVRQRVLPTLVEQELRFNGIRALAAVYRTARQLSIAGELYQQAYELSCDARLGTDLDSLFAHAQILLELGDLGRADTEARAVLTQTTDYSLKRRAYTLVARIAYDGGDSAKAIEMLDTLATLANSGETASDLVEVETLLLMRQILTVSGDTAAAERIDDLLLRLFPNSVAAGIANAESRQMTLPGLPSVLLLAQAADSEDAPAVRRDQPRLSAVQVGSFSDADNAEHLTADLQRLGLPARTEAISREGSTLHQVVVDISGGSTEDAAKIFSILRENGFDGFLVY